MLPYNELFTSVKGTLLKIYLNILTFVSVPHSVPSRGSVFLWRKRQFLAYTLSWLWCLCEGVWEEGTYLIPIILIYVPANKFTVIINVIQPQYQTLSSFSFRKIVLLVYMYRMHCCFYRLLKLWVVICEKRSIFLQLELSKYCTSWTI